MIFFALNAYFKNLNLDPLGSEACAGGHQIEVLPLKGVILPLLARLA